MQNNLASDILSHKNLFQPPLITYIAVRDLISETKNFGNCEKQRFANCEEKPLLIALLMLGGGRKSSSRRTYIFFDVIHLYTWFRSIILSEILKIRVILICTNSFSHFFFLLRSNSLLFSLFLFFPSASLFHSCLFFSLSLSLALISLSNSKHFT